MEKIVILTASVRTGRKSPRVSKYFQHYLKEHHEIDADMLDLKDYDFPLFDERLRFQKDPAPKAVEFSGRIRNAEGIIIVTPEYNGGYPASLKNAVDLLYDEWRKKPLVISTVSGGPFAGTQVITSLQFSLWKIGALTVPVMFPVPNIEKTFNEDGQPSDKEETDKRAKKFVDELLFYVKALKNTGK
jgi:NAD(P)H-dependent FMN reductase